MADPRPSWRGTLTAMLLHPPTGGLKAIPAPFLLGCVLAAVGAFIPEAHHELRTFVQNRVTELRFAFDSV